jgi:GTP-binding protein LepA
MLQCQGSKNSSFTKVIVALLVILSTLSMLFAAGRPNALLFLTDFGLKDGAVSAMKGVAFGVDPDLRMFDVTHDIPAFSVWEGAYRLKQTVEYWPANTVFVCVVDPGVGTERNPIVLKTKTGYYLVGPDNGLFSLVAEDMGIEEVRIIDVEKQRLPGSEKSYTFHGRDIFAYVGARLASGQIKFEDVGPVLEGDIVTIPYQKPTIEGNTVMGNIPVLDIQYGNVWSNIPDELFEMLNPQFGDLFYVEIFEDNNLVFEGEMPFVNSFGDVPEGDTLIYYNSLLNVSVAINMDNFSEVYGIYSGPEWTIKLTKILSEVSGTVSQIDKYGNVRTDIPADALTKEGFEVGDIVVIKVNDHLIQAPFVTTYGDVDRGKPLIRISDNYLTLAINYGNFGETYSLEVGDPVTIQLLKKGAYKSELEIRHLVKTNNRQDYESDEVFANFREVTVEKVPPPTLKGSINDKLKALVFDAKYDKYRGIIVYTRVFAGTVKKEDNILFMASGKSYEVSEVGVFHPEMVEIDNLSAGEIGYIIAGIKEIQEAKVGDTITNAQDPTDKPLPGYKEVKPMVYAGLYPGLPEYYEDLRKALEKLKLNDASLVFLPENSPALGYGFRVGFLGLLHMEIVKERIQREFDLAVILTVPSVIYNAKLKNGEVIQITNPSQFPDQEYIESVYEPYCKLDIITPPEFMGDLINLAQVEKRGEFLYVSNAGKNRVVLHFEIPLAEIIFDFFDKMKALSKGYASMDYELIGYRESKLVKIEIYINKEKVDALSYIVHESKAYEIARKLVDKLKDLIPRHQFEIPIQAYCKGKIIARSTIKALRKDVLQKCYGGDVTRKMKLLEKQKEGKKRMREIGEVSIPQEAFLALLKIDEDNN